MLVLREKAVFGIMLTLLLMGTLTLAFNIQPVKAVEPTIYIRDDGSVDPPTAPIRRDGDLYTLTGNIFYDIAYERDYHIGVWRDNIVIDGAGFTLQGPYTGCGIGIYLQDRNNVTIKNMGIKWFSDGIHLSSSSLNIIVSENKIIYCDTGIRIDHSSYNTIFGNNITNNYYGIRLRGSSRNSIFGNDITNNYWGGIGLEYSSNNTVNGNNIINNGDWGIGLYSQSSNNRFYHNNLENHPQVGSDGSPNIWDDGYPSGGNYWSDYAGVDVKSGSGQDLLGSDGIGDTPYIIDADNVDHYPLMYPYGAPLPQTYDLTITTTAGGTTDPAPGTYSYTVNSTIQVTAIPEADYLFEHWELDNIDVGSANPYTVLMGKDHTLRAVFSPVPAVPVGGYSIPIQVHTKAEPIIPYIALIAILITIFAEVKRKTNRKH